MPPTSGCSINSKGSRSTSTSRWRISRACFARWPASSSDPNAAIRFRCDFFPFVEPGVDFAVDCAICNGKGCRVCKHTGWLEMGGAGMVHPNVLQASATTPRSLPGFAFGLGIER